MLIIQMAFDERRSAKPFGFPDRSDDKPNPPSKRPLWQSSFGMPGSD